MTGAAYGLLSAEFDQVFTDVRGGAHITYVTGEQVITRLNEVLGVGGWTFRVLSHEINAEADEIWVLAELVALIDETSVTKQQFGSQKIHRSRSTGAPLDLGFDLKGAATDALKKCAMMLGVGLYLSRKEQPAAPARRPAPAPAAAPVRQQNTSGPPPCDICGTPIFGGKLTPDGPRCKEHMRDE